MKELSRDEIKEIDESLEIRKLVEPDFDLKAERDTIINSNIKFEYGPFVLNLKDVETFNLVDNNHTCIRLYSGKIYTFKIKHELFIALYQTLTGKLVQDFSNEDNINVKVVTNE